MNIMIQLKQEILGEANKLVENIEIIYDNLHPRDYFDDEDEVLGCDGNIAIEHHSFYDEVVEAVHGFKKFYGELVKRLDGDSEAETWFIRVENAVCWIKFGYEELYAYDLDDNVREMYNAYWRMVDKIHKLED